MNWLEELVAVILKRKQTYEASSYTCRLLNDGTLAERKVSEEAYEVIEAALQNKKKEMISESCDLLFHLLVLLAKHEISIEDIKKELFQRRKSNEND